MAMLQLTCDWCRNSFEKYSGEVKRQIKKGRKYFFCTRSCGMHYNNSNRPDRRIEVEKICPYCKKSFNTMSGSKSSTFCSASCASKGSMYEHRREAQRKSGRASSNLITVVESLKLRESWKYKKLSTFLDMMEEVHEFEYSLKNAVYDLALIDRKILIEFDAKYHEGSKQAKRDREKDIMANKHGWDIIRISTPSNAVIDPELLYEIVKPKI